MWGEGQDDLSKVKWLGMQIMALYLLMTLPHFALSGDH